MNKITAYFGADVSEVEAGMAKATRATKAYERAVQGLSKADAGSGLAKNVGKVDGLFGEMAKKFGAGKILESVLGGVGLANGFAIAQKGAELISQHWKEAAESAERIAKFSDESTDYALKRIGLRETEEQKLAKARQTAARADQALRADGGDDSERTAELVRNANKAQYELEVLEKAARERKAAADEKAAAEERKRFQQDQEWKMQAEERAWEQREREENARKDAAKEAAEFFKQIDEAAAKAHEKNADLQKQIDEERYQRTWDGATLEQRLAQVAKEGAIAKAKFDKDKSRENELALEKLKTKWLDLRDQIKAANKDAEGKNAAPVDLAANGRTRGEDGKLRRGRVVVSEEDAARSDATKARNARLNQEARRGQIRDAGRVGSVEKGNKTDELLQQIRDSLNPKKIS